MRFDFDFYSSLLLVFFMHIMVFAGLFFKKYYQQKQKANFWLGLFLLLAAFYIAPYMLGFAGWYRYQPYRDIMFYVPLQHLLLIGPVVFCYIQSLLNPTFSINKKNWIHFLPALWYLLYSLIIVVYDKLIVGEYYFLKNQFDPDLTPWYQWLGFISMLGYFIVSTVYYWKYRKVLVQLVSNVDTLSFYWIRNFLIAFLALIICWIIIALVDLFIGVSFQITWWYFLSFAIGCYYIAIAGYANAIKQKFSFSTTIFSKEPQIHFLPNITNHYLPYKMSDEGEALLIDTIKEETELQKWKEKITTLLEKDALYAVPELTLADIAKPLHTNISAISKIINQAFGYNFNDLINKYRIEAVIAQLRLGMQKEHTLLAIAMYCGFNSKTTFNRAFKKYKGYTPKEYIQKQNL